MSVSEQELFGLMAVAQEQQQAATLMLKRLEAQQAKLTQTIAEARGAVDEMNKAGHASALIIEKSTRIAVEKAVQGALESVQKQMRSTLGDSVNPAVKALQDVTGRAEEAEESLNRAAMSLNWKWAGIWAMTGCMLLTVFVVLSTFLVPSPKEIANLRANVEALEGRGGKVQLTECGPRNRLCAKINVNANKSTGGWGTEGQYMILQGY
jgi:hypothetical protein